MEQGETEFSDADYLKINAAKIVAFGVLMGWVTRGKPFKISERKQTPEEAKAAKRETQRRCMALMRERKKQQKEKNGDNISIN